MSQYGGGAGKNPPWVRQGQSMGMGVSQQSQMQQQMMPQMGNTAAAMLQYPQAQMYQQAPLGQLQQSGLAMQTMGTIGASQMAGAGGLSGTIQAGAGPLQQQQMYSQVGTVSYPTRTLITSPFTGGAGNAGVGAAGAGSAANSGNSQKQRVFTGTVTKVQDNFGFVDEEVFFQSSCCVKGSNPIVGDRVLVEAMYNASMPFKWNATRLQVLPMDQRNNDAPRGGNRGGYNSVPPPSDDMLVGVGGGGGDFGRRNRNKRNRENDFDRRPIPQNDDLDRKRRREDRRSDERSNRGEKDREREKEKEKEKEKERARSPRKRSKTPKRRKARIVPRYMVQIPKIALDMPEADVMEIKKRYTNLYVPSDFFVTSFKWVEVFPPHRPITLERPCAFHVMHKDVDPIIENDSVLDPPDVDYTYSAKVMLLSMPELSEIYQRCCALADEKEASQDERDFVHPTRLINFLVGLRGKNETMAIGGPWSPSLDGPNPEKDPTVLIKTAIRTCKALTGIDLKSCSQWYRFVEIYYHRAESVHKGKTVPARVETVVLYLPDVWNCLPTRLEWDGLHLNYKKQLDRLLNTEEEAEADEKDTSTTEVQKREPTHYAQLDPKVMKVNELREELEARSLSSKGLKSQLTARLAKVLKTEQDKEEEENAAKNEAEKASGKAEKDEKEEEKKKKEEEEKKKLDEKDRQLIEKRYTLPDKSHILVHPSRTAKSGKFDCTTMSLSLLLDYRPEDSKEHSFEVSLFAELFNEMLMRDFGFCIYKALMEAPEKPKEEKDDKSKDKDKKSDKDKDKKENDNKKEDKNEEKKEDKKDEKNSVQEEDNGSGEDDDSKKDKKDGDKEDKKKKEKPKLITVDPYLLLAFVYFDQTHCGYIFDKDLEELLFTLGLNLSRAQVKKLVQKIISRDSLHYRKLTDKPKDDPSITQNGVKTLEDLMTLALGNKRLFPVFEEGSPPSKRNRKGGSEKKDATELPSGFVMYNGSLLDVNNLQAQVKRSEESRLSTEKVLERTRSENSHMKEKTSQHISTIRKLSIELKDFKERLTNTNSELCNMDGKTKLYFAVMNEIYEKLGPIVAPPKPLLTKDEDVEDVEMEDATESIQGLKQPKETSTLQKIEVVNVKQEKHEQPKAESLQQAKVLVKPETTVQEANKSDSKIEEAKKPETEVQEAIKSETKLQEVNKPESEVKSTESNQSTVVSTVKPEASDVLKPESKDSEVSQSIVKTEVSQGEEKSTEEKSTEDEEVTASPRTRSGNKADEKKTPGKK